LAEVAPLLRVLEAGVDLHVEHLPEPRYDGTKWGARSSAYGDFTFTADTPLAAIAALSEALET
ncbi:MAG TPA: hypothetical protein VJP59_00190, partial [Gemmatimonadota bacterium]|nr:hypothetical protein [Gemmatimonadota bacterium]